MAELPEVFASPAGKYMPLAALAAAALVAGTAGAWFAGRRRLG
jgi:hypothetical protein